MHCLLKISSVSCEIRSTSSANHSACMERGLSLYRPCNLMLLRSGMHARMMMNSKQADFYIAAIIQYYRMQATGRNLRATFPSTFLHSYIPQTTHLNPQLQYYEYEYILCDLQDSAPLSARKTCAFFLFKRSNNRYTRQKKNMPQYSKQYGSLTMQILHASMCTLYRPTCIYRLQYERETVQ